MIQLPDDIKATGYKKVKPFQFEQTFYSKSCNFEGTEKEFINAGYGYEYIILGPYTRGILT